MAFDHHIPKIGIEGSDQLGRSRIVDGDRPAPVRVFVGRINMHARNLPRVPADYYPGIMLNWP
jgi:hypothetical protein